MIKRLAFVLVIFAAVALTAPASPIHVSYVYSDSMEPTLDVNDGYVVVSGAVEQGDIAVFHSSERNEYVTHRVVDRTDAGFVTKGDNNDVTDQSTGHPYVQREDIVGTVLTVGGEPLTIPNLGVVASLLAGNRLLVAAIGGLLVVGSMLYDAADSDRPGRSIVRVSDVTHPLLVVALLAAVGILLTGAVTHDMTFVAVDGGGGGANTLTVGEPGTEELLISVPSRSFTYRMLDTEGATMTAYEANASAVSATLRIPPQDTHGTHDASLAVYRYPAVLPEGVVRSLHTTSPVFAASATVGALFAPIFLVYAVLFDGTQPLRFGRSRRRPKWRGNR